MEYTKKHNRERGPALVGVKVKSPFDFEQIKQNMNIHHITYKFIDPDSEIFRLLL
jgi:threonine dehydratase